MTTLTDPLNNRVISTAPFPYRTPLSNEQIFNAGKINIDLLMDFLVRQGKLQETTVIKILKKAKQLFQLQPNLVNIKSPVTVIGDIHGQYYDLVNMLKNGLIPPIQKSKYLFLGDYVDRGLFSIEVVLLVLSYKITYPKKVFLLRGNHECRQLTSHFNFRTQCLKKYSQSIYELFMEVFDTLPLSALINNSFLCLHGGISQGILNLRNIKQIDRFQEIPKDGNFCDIVWSDPVDEPKGKMPQITQFNQSRGCSYYYGAELCRKVLETNNIVGIIRAHQAKQEGYQMHKWFGQTKFPPVITIFSAPNYANFYNNKGAVIKIGIENIQIVEVKGSESPYHLPDNINLFEWSVPFLIERVNEFFEQYFALVDKKEQNKDHILVELVDRRKMIEELKNLQEDQSNIEIIKFKGKNVSKQLINNKQAMSYMVNNQKKDFNKEKQIDKMNQMRPQFQQFFTPTTSRTY